MLVQKMLVEQLVERGRLKKGALIVQGTQRERCNGEP